MKVVAVWAGPHAGTVVGISDEILRWKIVSAEEPWCRPQQTRPTSEGQDTGSPAAMYSLWTACLPPSGAKTLEWNLDRIRTGSHRPAKQIWRVEPAEPNVTGRCQVFGILVPRTATLRRLRRLVTSASYATPRERCCSGPVRARRAPPVRRERTPWG